MFEGLRRGELLKIGLVRPEFLGNDLPDPGRPGIDLRSVGGLAAAIPWRTGEMLTAEILEVVRDRAVVRLGERVWLADLDFPARAGETITVQVAGFQGGKPLLQVVSESRTASWALSFADLVKFPEIMEWLQNGSGPVNAPDSGKNFPASAGNLAVSAGNPPGSVGNFLTSVGNLPEPARAFTLRLMAQAELPSKVATAQAIYEYLRVPEPLGEVLLRLPQDAQSSIGRYFYTPVSPDWSFDWLPEPAMTQASGPAPTTAGFEGVKTLPALLGQMDSEAMDPEMRWVKEARAILTGLRALNGVDNPVLHAQEQAQRDGPGHAPNSGSPELQGPGWQQAQSPGLQPTQNSGLSQAPAVTFLQIPVVVDGEAFTVHLRLSRREEPRATRQEERTRGRQSRKGSAEGAHLSLTIYLETRWLGALKVDLRFGSGRSLNCAIQVEQERTRQLLAEHYPRLSAMVAEAGFSLNSVPRIAVRKVRRTPDTPLSVQNLQDFVGTGQDSPGREAHAIDLRL